ncbi:hypothetical protein HO173_013123 [Letharia columbiana]|uniref:Uncharacterized protein n=1 Tax=Letharia columbiana TaxID=112416 RepID=A0A8H6FCU5_9LECA|nr:uncharacterized protein HO173_013123 [Letharia columbiana]KAF6223792.1 hypothetical protein HO173_013123 [Letharia columbiana]
MHPSPQLLALAASALLSSTTSASPLQPSATATYTSSSPLGTKSVDCSNVSTGLAPACWFTLNMTTYLNNWVTTSPYGGELATGETPGSTNPSPATSSGSAQASGNPFADDVTTGTNSSSYFRKRIVARTAAAPASGQCEGGKPFSTCFLLLQQGYGSGKFNCSKINTGGANGTCPAPRPAYYANNPQAFYAVWNFYAINAYISTFHRALRTLALSSPAVISTAATEAAPKISYFQSANQTLSIDVALLDLLVRSTGGHELPGGQNTPFLTLLEGDLSKVTYGEATPPATLALLMQGRLEQVLREVMRDERVFVKVAGNGAFSTRGLLSVEGLVKVLGG